LTEVRYFPKASFGEVHGSGQVRLQNLIGMIVAVSHRTDCCQMNHCFWLNLMDDSAHGKMVSQITEDGFQTAVRAEDVTASHVALQREDLVVLLQQPCDQVSPDKPGHTGNKYAHPFLRSSV